MLEVPYHYFERSFPLTETDKALIKSVVSSRKIKKGEFLVRAGQVSRYGGFVTKGFLRSYIIDNKGKEHIMQFAPENRCISDKTGMSEGKINNVQAEGPFIYTEKVMKLNKSDFHEIFKKNGLKPIKVYGDYKLNEYQVETSPSLILLAQKTGNVDHV